MRTRSSARTMFRADPAHAGCNAEQSVTDADRGLLGAGVYSSPAVANGVVVVGGEDNNVDAFIDGDAG